MNDKRYIKELENRIEQYSHRLEKLTAELAAAKYPGNHIIKCNYCEHEQCYVHPDKAREV